ncbi:9638_t:CDS:2 [Ambispora leptoticha]|uniref:9638_t:CDS:1 n=1 Tax=Ambispora leptoticha TaxID=144679 RepID=A0A9N8VI41_9GLOM|nr:9638_t:CDS:2 [Ambispora leptoticha]
MTTVPQIYTSHEENSVSLEAEIQSIESSIDTSSNNFSKNKEQIAISSNIQPFSPELADKLEEISTASLCDGQKQIPTMEQEKQNQKKDVNSSLSTSEDILSKQDLPGANNQKQTTPILSAENSPIKSSFTTQVPNSNTELHSPMLIPLDNTYVPVQDEFDNVSNETTTASKSPKKIDAQELKDSDENKNDVASTNDIKQEIPVSSTHDIMFNSKTLQNSGEHEVAINKATDKEQVDNKVNVSNKKTVVGKQEISCINYSKLAEASPPSNAGVIDAIPTTRELPAACLFVASLSTNKPDAQLQKAVLEHFIKWGTVMNVKVLKDPQQRPYAFVQYENVSDARNALVQAHNTQIEGRLIRVEQARVNRTLFLGRLNRNFKEEDIKRLVAVYGETEDVHLLRNYYTGRSKCCAFIKFCYRDDAIRAYISLRQNATYITEWATNIERAVPRPEDIDNLSIFVGWLNENLVTSDILKQRFEKYGEIDDLNLINRQSARNSELRPAFAFIKYKNEASVREAIKNENNALFLGRNIRVEPKESPEFRQLKSELLRQQQLIRNRSLQNYTAMTIPPPIHYQPLTANASSNRRPFTASPKKSNTKQKKFDTNQQAGNQQPSQQRVDIDTEISNRRKETEKNQAANKFCGGSDKVAEDKSLLNRKQQQQSQSNSATVTSFGSQMIPPPLMNQQPNYMPEVSTMGIPWTTHEGTPHEMLYYAAPFIQTPEGPIYPYAPPVSFMGNPTLTTSSLFPMPYYNSEFYHETPALVPQPTHLSPMNFHEYMAPVIPGQRDSLFAPQESANKMSKVITPPANMIPIVNTSNTASFQTSAFTSTFQESFASRANNNTTADAQMSEANSFRGDPASVELSTTVAASDSGNSGTICHNDPVELTSNTSSFPQ